MKHALIAASFVFMLAAASPLWAATGCDGTEPQGLTQKRSMILDMLSREQIDRNLAHKAEELLAPLRNQPIDPGQANALVAQLQDMQKRCVNQTLNRMADIEEKAYSEDEVKTMNRVTKLEMQKDSRQLSADEKQFLSDYYSSQLHEKEKGIVPAEASAMGKASAAMAAEFQEKVTAAFPDMPPPAPPASPFPPPAEDSAPAGD
ncbi:MAG TPA: hypothetical protein VHB73_03220 [Alphaproteobacteria bacterium]|nr:hypothetical protein [Alphaproteobacteria bacterium]